MSKDVAIKTTWLDVPKVCLVKQYTLKKGVQEVESELAEEVVKRGLGKKVPTPTKEQIENSQPRVGDLEPKEPKSEKPQTNP